MIGLNVNDFDFYLPEELIAQTPLEARSQSRLLVLDRDRSQLYDSSFTQLVNEVSTGDCLVLNDTKVLPARLIGEKKETGAVIEFLLLKQTTGDCWETLVKPAKRVKVGTVITFGDGKLIATCVEEKEDGGRIVEFYYDGLFYELLDELGTMPLPPYIKERLDDQDRYQTVYAKQLGSAAAPTAGLHFTTDLLHALKQKGVSIVYLTLHVGLGTFRPVSADDVLDHKMHEEYYELTEEAAKTLQETKERGNHIIAVGTTSARTLETIASKHGKFVAETGWTSIFIYPGYTFKGIDGLVTNFHLPKSTLVMLVSAMAGKDFLLGAYAHAVKNNYRFFSFGDAMFIRPHVKGEIRN